MVQDSARSAAALTSSYLTGMPIQKAQPAPDDQESAKAEFQRELMRALEVEAAERLPHMGLSVMMLSATEVASRMFDAIPDSNTYSDTIGSFYDTPGLIKLRGGTRQNLYKQSAAGKLLSMKSAEGDIVYPAFQFTTGIKTLPGLTDVISALRLGFTDPWDIALWLTTKTRVFGGKSAAELLRAGHINEVLIIAARDAERLAS